MKVISKLNVPESWNEVSFGTYQLLTGLELSSADRGAKSLDNNIKIIATITNSNVKTIEALKGSDFISIQHYLEFLSSEIVHTNKVKWNFIPINKLTMDKWMAYEKYKLNPEENLTKILALLQTEYTEAQIKEMAVTEVLRGFFILQKRLLRYIKSSQLSLVRKMGIVIIKESWKRVIQGVKMKLRIG